MASPNADRAVQRAVAALTEHACRGESTLHGAARAHDALHAWAVAGDGLADLRTNMIRQALNDGYTYADLSTVIGISRQRLQQIAEPLPPGMNGSRPGRRPADEDRSEEAEDLRARRERCPTNRKKAPQ